MNIGKPNFDKWSIPIRRWYQESTHIYWDRKILDPNNIKNLKYINPGDVEKVIREINKLSDAVVWDREVVVGIGTGGTIPMKKNPKTWLLEPDMDFDSILKQAWSGLTKDYLFLWVDALRIDSSQMTPEYIADISLAISYMWMKIEKKISWFLVLHGTDTMAPSASRTAMQLWSWFPHSIVYTWAQKPMSYRRNDAVDNIVNGFHTLTAAANNNVTETIIAFWRKSMLAVWTVKSSGSHSDAFSSPMHEYIMDHWKLEEPLDIHLPWWLRRNDAAKTYDPRIERKSSDTVFIPANMYNRPEDTYEHIMNKKPSLVVLETYWANTASSSIVEAVSVACKNLLIPWLTISSVDELPGTATYASSDMLIQAWLVPINMLFHTAQAKADRIISSWIWLDANFIKQLMTTAYINEIPNANSLWSQ